jgi:hypothetical protein
MSRPHYPLYIGDFLKETASLSAEQIGMHTSIMAACWCNDEKGFVELSWTDLKFVCKANSEQHVKQTLSKIKAKKIISLEIVSEDEDLELEIVRVSYPPMVHQYEVSQVRAQAGSQGGKASQKKKSLKKSPQAKLKQNSDIAIGNDNEAIKEKKGLEGKTILVNTSFTEAFLPHWARWKKYKAEIKSKFKTESSERLAFVSLFKISGASESVAAQIIDQSIANGWKGLFEIKPPSITKPKLNGNAVLGEFKPD